MYTCTHVHMYTCTHVHTYTCRFAKINIFAFLQERKAAERTKREEEKSAVSSSAVAGTVSQFALTQSWASSLRLNAGVIVVPLAEVLVR
jgi:hypothetical protein